MYNKMQEEVAREVQAGRRDEAMQAGCDDFRAETGRDERAPAVRAGGPERLAVDQSRRLPWPGAFEGADQANAAE